MSGPRSGLRPEKAAALDRAAIPAFRGVTDLLPARQVRLVVLARFGAIRLSAQAKVPNALRTDIHEEAFIKAGARRVRDFPNIHSASPAQAGRHET
jgi:hypothetical protein